MRDAEVHSAAAREDFVADRRRDGIGIALRVGVLFGVRDADLHRSGGAHGIEAAEHALAERHHVGEVREDVVQLFFGLHLVEALAIGRAGRRLQRERGVHGQHRDVIARGAVLDLTLRDGGEAGDLRVDLERRFLFGRLR